MKELRKWTSKKVVHSLPPKVKPSILLELYALTPYSRRQNQHVLLAPVSRSSLVRLTAWHTHPLGQTLIVTAGCGLAQRPCEQIEQIRPGDVI